MGRQLSMLPPKPRAPRRKLMHVVDAGEISNTMVVRFHCFHCGHESDWHEMRSVTEEKRGRPCPECNGGE